MRREIPLLLGPAFEDWECPRCHLSERVKPLPPGASRYHPCPRLHGLNAPLVRAGADAKLEAVLREDYLNGEVQAHGDDGRAYQAVQVTYADGHTDLGVNAGLARVKLSGED